jgi:DnaJ-class molecular chaperone
MWVTIWVIVVATSHYTTLGVTRQATDDEIKKAYRTMALKWHPDKASAANQEACAERFKQITEAYSVLSDRTKRRQYDVLGDPRTRHHAQHAHAHQGFDSFQDAGFQFHRFAPPTPAESLPQARRAFRCSLQELDAGCRKKFTLKDSPISRQEQLC